MSGLLFLKSEDFQVMNGGNGPIMCTNIPGFSLILFYSSVNCKFCDKLIPIFKQLPGTVGGCQFGMINVIQNKQCILMSRETIAPIKEVPYIILYVKGKPYMRYRGPHEGKEISKFIMEVAKNVQSKQTFAKDDQRIKQATKASGIPAYTIGHPLCGQDDDVCYLEFDEAYGVTVNQPQQRKGKIQQGLPPQSGMSGAGRQAYTGAN